MMSELKTQGTVVEVSEQVVNEAGTWQKLTFVIKIENDYNPARPNYAKFAIGNKPDAEFNGCENFIKFNKVGDLVDVDFNLSGFTFKDKNDGHDVYANSLSAWRVRTVKDEEPAGGTVEDEDVEGDADPFLI
jgi:hypothetical protein